MKKRIILCIILIGVVVGFISLSFFYYKAKINNKVWPELISAELSSYHEGSEETQYVQVDLKFNRKISISDSLKDTLRITIGGNRVKDNQYVLKRSEEDESTVILLISVEAVTNGIIKIQSEKDFTLEAIIPSGITLSTIKESAGTVVKQVDSTWAIRGIAWIGLTEDGALIPVSETDNAEMLDGYAAVHGHEFLMLQESDVAKQIVEVLEANYGEEYQFSCDKNQITVTKPGEDAALDIVNYQYLKINEK